MQTLSFPLSGSQKVKSLPVSRLEGFAAIAAFAFGGAFLAAAEQGLGDDGFGLVGALAHGIDSHVVEHAQIIGQFFSVVQYQKRRITPLADSDVAHTSARSGGSSCSRQSPPPDL